MKSRKTYSLIAFAIAAIILASCDNEPKPEEKTEVSVTETTPSTIKVPEFNADSAYAFTKKQVDFGPRIPNTPAQDKCAAWLISKLKQYTSSVEVQQTKVTAYDGTQLKCKNIIAKLNPEKKARVALFSHWDTRPWADQDTDKKYHNKPFDGANDGPSGVAVILEIARQMSISKPEIGVTVVFLDVEDYGVSADENSYCLGTQYWATNFNRNKDMPDFGVLLDMVGAPNSHFMFERTSQNNAQFALDKIWKEAASLNYGKYFIAQSGGGVTDDHVFINGIAKIPTVDIIDYDDSRPGGFGYYWHTHFDNMKVIDKDVLKAVGQTLLSVIYKEGR